LAENRQERCSKEQINSLALDFVSYLAAIFILTSGFLGELRAVLALYNGRASAATGQFVLLSVVVLLVVATFGPAAGLARTIRMSDKFLKEPTAWKRSSSEQFNSPGGKGTESISSDE
jgi:hypothetical protein